MKFVHKNSGTIYNVTNEALLPLYKGSELFSEVIEKVPDQEEKPKKTTKKK